jgi:hypothetical protein
MGGGSKTVKTETEIPDWAESAAKYNIDRSQRLAEIGYAPYYGPDVAALTPMQEAANANARSAASAFGLEAGSSSLPKPKDYGGGVRGYSSGDMFDKALQELKDRRPGQYEAIMALFTNPWTGEKGQLQTDREASQGGPIGGRPITGVPYLDYWANAQIPGVNDPERPEDRWKSGNWVYGGGRYMLENKR